MVKVPRGYRSRNVQDRRGSRGRGGGGGFGFPTRQRGGGSGLGGSMGGGGLGGSMGGGSAMPGGLPTGSRRGCGGGMGMLIVLVLVAFLAVQCLSGGSSGIPDATGGGGLGGTSRSEADPSTYSTDEVFAFDLANATLDDVQAYWDAEFTAAGQRYAPAGLVIFDGGGVSTGGCGQVPSNVGPFYCPADSNAYIDIPFMFRLQRQLGAEGDFAQAFILAHEIGHHVQNVLGINNAVRQAQSVRGGAYTSNELSVFMELQADCLAGMWAGDLMQRTNEILASGDQDLINNSLLLEDGDIEEGVRAAHAVGDDAISGDSNPVHHTHGSSAQRVQWFSIGFENGSWDDCYTFPDGSI